MELEATTKIQGELPQKANENKQNLHNHRRAIVTTC